MRSADAQSLHYPLAEHEESGDDEPWDMTTDAPGADAPGQWTAEDYGFAGYTIEFNDRLALLPPQAAPDAAATGRR